MELTNRIRERISENQNYSSVAVAASPSEWQGLLDACVEWISVDDRLPDDDILVLVFSGANEPVWPGYLDDDGEWRFCTGGHCRPSHWMDLPEPPQ